MCSLEGLKKVTYFIECREEFLAKGAIRVIPRYFQVGLGLGEGLGFKISTASATPGITKMRLFALNLVNDSYECMYNRALIHYYWSTPNYTVDLI